MTDDPTPNVPLLISLTPRDVELLRQFGISWLMQLRSTFEALQAIELPPTLEVPEMTFEHHTALAELLDQILNAEHFWRKMLAIGKFYGIPNPETLDYRTLAEAIEQLSGQPLKVAVNTLTENGETPVNPKAHPEILEQYLPQGVEQ